MKLFLDTNIFMDLLFGRKNAGSAKQIIHLVQTKTHEGIVADITVLNIDYVAQKQGQESRSFLSLIEKYFTITGADNIDIHNALDMKNVDLEDNVQTVLALKSACDLIITNDKAFVQTGITVLNAGSFLQRYPST